MSTSHSSTLCRTTSHGRQLWLDVHIDMNRLRLHVPLQALWTALTPDTALLEAAEGRLGRSVECGIDADGAGFELTCDTERTSDI